MYTISVFALCGILLIISGVLIREFKFYNLIAGYNTMPVEKKKTYNPKPLANKLGIFLYALGIFTVLTGLLLYFTRGLKHIENLIAVSYAVIIFVSSIAFIAKNAKTINDRDK